MRKFQRQVNGHVPDINLDFGAAEPRIGHTYEPGEYAMRVESARVIQRNNNVLIVLDLVEAENNRRVDTRPLWVDGPNSNAGNLVAENQHLIAQLLTIAKLPTAGNVGELIPKLGGLEFTGRLVLAVDSRSGRSFNAVAEVYMDDAS
jgi:hypothetical protein